MRPTNRVSTFAIACSLLALGACTTSDRAAAPAAMAVKPLYAVPTQLPTNVRPVHYSISAVPDAANLSFGATTYIDVDVVEATDEITLNAADLTFGAVTLTDTRGTTVPARETRLDADKQTATFEFADAIAPGRYRLSTNYSGKIGTQAAGLFALDYPSADGSGEKRALFTQFQAPDARRFFPGWDEPQFRTPYDLRVTVPSSQMAVSNMPQKTRVDNGNGTSTVTFATSPPMSSYLLFVGAGEFDRITTTAGGTEIGVIAKKGDGEKGRYALEGSAQIVPYYNDYFGTPYPLPKLDNIAGPGSSQFFSAMENWGAIFSFEDILLVDPKITTEATRQGIFGVAAHEIAHQWFGNLVTMAWWDDLWLNEGFASWMATKATDALHPEWEPLLSRVGGREAAMGLDSVVTTHPVVQRVTTVDQINQAFDAITYQKGEAVITMMEDYVGAEAWQRGVQDYTRTYRLKNTVTDDLWAKIETAADGKPVTAIAHDFTLQPGVPLIRVESATCAGGRTNVSLRQAEFTRDRQDKQPLAWRVPIIAATLGGAPVRALVEGGAASIAVPGCDPLIVNSGQTGYYRTLYTPALLDRVTESYARLRPVDQIGLLSDNWALGLAGYQSAAEALDMIDRVPANANTQLWSRAAGILGQIYFRYDGDAARQALVSRYTIAKLMPVLNRLGWNARADEKSNDAVLRSALIATLGAVGEPGVVAEANRRYAMGPAGLDGPLRGTILSVVSRNLTPAQWDATRAAAGRETNQLIRSQLYQLLGAADDEALARRALALALTPEPGATNAATIIRTVAAIHPDLAFDFALANRDAVNNLVDASSRSRYIASLGTGSSNPAIIAKIEDYASRYLTPESRRPADQAIVAIRDRVRVRETRLPDISRWFEAKMR